MGDTIGFYASGRPDPDAIRQRDGFRRVVRSSRKAAEAVAKLAALDGRDPEIAHGEADVILCDVLRDAGLGEVAEAFEKARERVGFWYN